MIVIAVCKSIVMMLGGRCAEALVLDDICTGASNDIERATATARNMVTKYGFSEKLGTVVYGSDNDEVFLGKDYGHVNNYSEATSARIDAEVEKIMREAYNRTVEILSEHFDKLELVANTLLEKEKISGEDFESLMKKGVLPSSDEQEVSAPENNDATAPEIQNENTDAAEENTIDDSSTESDE